MSALTDSVLTDNEMRCATKMWDRLSEREDRRLAKEALLCAKCGQARWAFRHTWTHVFKAKA